MLLLKYIFIVPILGHIRGESGTFSLPFQTFFIYSPVFQILGDRVREYTTFISVLRLCLVLLFVITKEIFQTKHPSFGDYTYCIYYMFFFLLALSAVAEEWPVFYPKQDIDAFLMDYTARPNKLCAADLFPVWIRDKEQGSEGGFWWRHFCKPGERLFWE